MEYPFTSYRFGGDLKTICMLKTPFLYYRAFQADSCIPNRNGHFWPHRPLQTFYDPNNMYPPPPLKEIGTRRAGKRVFHHPNWKTNITSGNFFCQRFHLWYEIYWESLLMGFRQISSYLPEQVPANKFLFAGIVPANKFLFAGTVPANKFLFAGTVPANNLFLLF